MKNRLFDAGTQQCWGAFMVLLAMTGFVIPEGTPMFGVCKPIAVRQSQLVAIFVQYAEQLPARWNEDFVVIALESLQNAFPCKQQRLG